MRIEKQNFSLPILDNNFFNEKKISKHGDLFCGSSKRALVVGPSGCGKTNVIINLLLHPNGLRFENVYIYSKSLYQPKYQYLKMILEPMKDIGYFEYDLDTDIVSPNEIKSNSIIIFDDVINSSQLIMREYFCFGRHKDTDSFYLSQTYSSIPKQLIRDNANLLIIFPQDVTNLKHIYDDHVSVDMSFQKFKEMCSLCWSEPNGFIVIDKDCTTQNGRYRKGFDSYIYI